MIRKIKWNNHKVLGNLELDFTDSNGQPFSTIVIAGENGTGKTTIMKTLSVFLNKHGMDPFDYIEYAVDGENYKIFYEDENDGRIGFHIREKISDGSRTSIRRNSNNSPDGIDRDENDLRKYGVIYSTARSGFKTNKIKSSTTLQLDTNKYDLDENDDFTSIKQLLVDLDGQDNSEWMKISRDSSALSKTTYSNFQEQSRMHRFTKAFNDFFENLAFKEINNDSVNEKEVLFQKDGREISIDDLSTGEKQIVFRGTQILRNSNAVNGGEILIDEPELSMHPRWQNRILDFYMELVAGKKNQLIIATHSEYVLRAALNRNDVLVIVLQNDSGSVIAKKITAPTVLPTITFAETDYFAFGMPSTDYHIELYGYLQHKNNDCSVKACDDVIKNSVYYDVSRHMKPSNGLGSTTYETLPTYIRNAIDHPNNGNVFTEDELKRSIKLLIDLCR